MEIILNILIGFTIMCVLIGISAIPIFVVQHFKKNCSTGLKWLLLIVSILVYILLSATCRYYGILADRKGIPITPLIILSILAGINLFHSKKPIVQENIEQTIIQNAISTENNLACKKKLNKKIYIITTALITLLITCVFIVKHIDFRNNINNYWEHPYQLTRIEVLGNEIDLFELKRQIPEKSYDDQVKTDGYFYNIRLVKDKEYAILFDVWKENDKITNERIVEDMQCIASLFLKNDEQDKIKVLIRIAPKGHMDTEDTYNGYIPSNIFNNCKKCE